MNLLIKILQAAHCRSTHQFFVMDALPLVTSPRSQRLCSVLLKYHQAYLIGSKDPDKTFRDFGNHVLHVGDNHWGGAPKSAEKWYAKLRTEMEAERWEEAAYSAGVLSHYFTDPLMPLHTGQSDIESVIHRPMEWSVTKSYARIRRQWQADAGAAHFALPYGANWMSTSVIRGATVAHTYYNELIDRYDLEAGSKNPVAGFDDRSREILAKLFGMAITGWAQILQRVADEADVAIPQMPLSMTTVVAALKMPSAWITRRIESNEERAAVKAIFDEFQSTGIVVENLPVEVTTVRQERQLDRIRAGESPNTKRVETTVAQKPVAPPVAKDPVKLVSRPITKSVSPAVLPIQRQGKQTRKPRLAIGDNLVDAPSIGPKTAKRFARIGVTTVAQFLAASADQMATRIDTRWITAEKIGDWQAQARLVCDVASLCGYKSQLLVAVGVRKSDTLARQVPAELCELIGDFTQTSDGQRILRSSNTPELDDVRLWVSDAQELVNQRKSA
ncbi:MAG: DUF4332 domain-containing protein [Pirellulaceae bacterium]